MVDKRRDNRTSDDLLADLDALEELLGPTRSFSVSGNSAGGAPAPTTAAAPARAPATPERRSQAPKESAQVANKDRQGPERGPHTGGKKTAEEQIPLLEDVVLPGVKKPAGRSRAPEPKPQLPSRAEIDSWVELAIETRLEPLKKQLRRELWEELLRRFPALRDEGR